MSSRIPVITRIPLTLNILAVQEHTFFQLLNGFASSPYSLVFIPRFVDSVFGLNGTSISKSKFSSEADKNVVLLQKVIFSIIPNLAKPNFLTKIVNHREKQPYTL